MKVSKLEEEDKKKKKAEVNIIKNVRNLCRD